MPEDRFVTSIYRSSEHHRAFGPRAGMFLGMLGGGMLAGFLALSGSGALAAFLAYSLGASLTLFAVTGLASIRPVVLARRAAVPLNFHRI